MNKSVNNFITLLHEGYDVSVAMRMIGRAGSKTVTGGKGIALEVMVSDLYNAENILKGKGYHTGFTHSSTATQVDLITMNGKKIVERIQCKDTSSLTGISKTLQQVESGKYNAAKMVGTTETAQLFNIKAASKGINKVMKDSGISTKDTTRISNKLNGVISPVGMGKIALQSAKIGGAISGGIAVVETITNGDDIEDPFAHISTNIIKGSVTSGIGTLASEGTILALAAAPVPIVVKGVIGIGMGICAGTVIGDISSELCEEAGNFIAGMIDPIVDVTAGVADTATDVVCDIWEIAEDIVGGFL